MTVPIMRGKPQQNIVNEFPLKRRVRRVKDAFKRVTIPLHSKTQIEQNFDAFYIHINEILRSLLSVNSASSCSRLLI